MLSHTFDYPEVISEEVLAKEWNEPEEDESWEKL